MTENQVVAFIAAARQHATLKEELRTADSPDEVVTIAEKHDFTFSVDTLASTAVELETDSLSDVAVRRAGFRIKQFGNKHWFGWK